MVKKLKTYKYNLMNKKPEIEANDTYASSNKKMKK